MHIRTRQFLSLSLVIVSGLTLAVSGLKVGAEEQEGKEGEEKEVALPAAQVIDSVNTAVGARAGNVLNVESESEGGKTVCEVTIIAADGKAYEVEVDVATNKVLEVEAADEEDEKDD